MVLNSDSWLLQFRRWTDIGRPIGNLWLVVLIGVLLLFANLHRGDLGGYDDAVYAFQARQVLETGQWGTLRLNGSADFDKPPLFVWIIAVFFRVFGAGDCIAKLPVAILGFLTVLLTGELARRITKNGWVAILSMIVLLSTQYFLKYATHVMHAVPLTFLFTLSIYLYTRYLSESNRQVLLLGVGIVTGLAALTVSPVGFFPLVIIGIDLLLRRRYDLLVSRQIGLMLTAALMIPLGWYLWEYHLFGVDFLRGHFANIVAHAVTREERGFLTKILKYFEYPILLLRHYWPWLPFMLFGLVAAMRRSSIGRSGRADYGSTLLCLWVVIVVVPFSLAESRVLRYILPAFPAFSILAATTLEKFIATNRRRFMAVAWVILGAVAIGATLFPNIRFRAEDMRRLAPVVASQLPVGRRVVLYTAGEMQWEHRNTLIWYADRLVWHELSVEGVIARLRSEPGAIAIIDQQSFDRFESAIQERFESLARSQRFLLVRLKPGG